MPLPSLGVTSTGPVGSVAADRVGPELGAGAAVVFSGFGQVHALPRGGVRRGGLRRRAPAPASRPARRRRRGGRSPVRRRPGRSLRRRPGAACARVQARCGEVLPRSRGSSAIVAEAPPDARNSTRSRRPSTGGGRARCGPSDRAHPGAMTISVDVAVIRQHRLGLLTDADEVRRRCALDPPDVGAAHRPDRRRARPARAPGPSGWPTASPGSPTPWTGGWRLRMPPTDGWGSAWTC